MKEKSHSDDFTCKCLDIRWVNSAYEATSGWIQKWHSVKWGCWSSSSHPSHCPFPLQEWFFHFLLYFQPPVYFPWGSSCPRLVPLGGEWLPQQSTKCRVCSGSTLVPEEDREAHTARLSLVESVLCARPWAQKNGLLTEEHNVLIQWRALSSPSRRLHEWPLLPMSVADWVAVMISPEMNWIQYSTHVSR